MAMGLTTCRATKLFLSSGICDISESMKVMYFSAYIKQLFIFVISSLNHSFFIYRKAAKKFNMVIGKDASLYAFT